MDTVCHDEASCLTTPLPLGPAVPDRAMTEGLPCTDGEKAEPSATGLVRLLSEAANPCRTSECTQADLARLLNLVGQATAHVQRHGINTVDHIVLSGALKMIARDIPAVANVLQQQDWQWFGR